VTIGPFFSAMDVNVAGMADAANNKSTTALRQHIGNSASGSLFSGQNAKASSGGCPRVVLLPHGRLWEYISI
jgi:hypothetical protein